MAAADNSGAVRGGSGSTGTPANGNGSSGRRRSSQGTSLFSGLMSQKRNSEDATAAARRQSFHDQKPAAGIVGQMWHNFTTGGSAEKK